MNSLTTLDHLTPEEISGAYEIGIKRAIRKATRRQVHRFGYDPEWEEYLDTEGLSAVSEKLVSKITGQAWNTGDRPDDPLINDVGNGISVRHTKRMNGSLLVHEDEAPILKCVLVVGPLLGMIVRGWAYAREAQMPAWWRTKGVRHPAYFYRGALRPVEELRYL